MAAFAGLRGTGDWATDQRPKNFREFILWRNPNGMTPLFALMAKIGKESTNDPEFSWWDEAVDLVRLRINKAADYGTSETLLTVDSADPNASAPGVAWGTALNLVAGDVLMVEPATDSATFDHEQVLVTAVHSATQFSVQRAYAGTAAAAIVDNIHLIKIGSSFAEGTDAPLSASRNPTKFYNYTQIFKTTYELTGTADNTMTRTGDEMSNDKKRKMFDHSRDIEMAMLFGKRSETVGSNGKPLRTTNGLRAQISSNNTTILAANWTLANSAGAGNNFLDAISGVFDFESQSGDERVIFAGNNALNRLNQAIHKGTGVGATSINFQGNAKLYGMNFQEFTLPQGRVFIKTHPLMNRHDIYKNSMFVLDFGAMKYRPMEGRDTKSKNDIQAAGEDVRRGMWQTEAGLEVTGGGLTMGYIGGFDAAIA